MCSLFLVLLEDGANSCLALSSVPRVDLARPAVAAGTTYSCTMSVGWNNKRVVVPAGEDSDHLLGWENENELTAAAAGAVGTRRCDRPT